MSQASSIALIDAAIKVEDARIKALQKRIHELEKELDDRLLKLKVVNAEHEPNPATRHILAKEINTLTRKIMAITNRYRISIHKQRTLMATTAKKDATYSEVSEALRRLLKTAMRTRESLERYERELQVALGAADREIEKQKAS